MSTFGGLIFTNKGRNLQAKAQAGAQLNFTRFGVGDGELGGSSIADLNALKHEVKSLGIGRLRTLADGKALVGTVLSNQDLQEGFYFRELGVFAQDPDLGEILYCYGNAGANAEYIPAGGGPDIIEKNIDVITIVGNASSVTAVIDESLIYATIADLTALQEDFTGHTNAADPHPQYATDTDLSDLAGTGRTTETVKGNASNLAAHMADTANPHQTTATQVGALVSVDGVSNPGGNIDLVAGANISITPDDTNNRITIGGTGTWPNADTVDGAHAGTAANNVLKLDASGLVPLTNIPTTLTGKNADQLDGYHAGNSSGQIPVSNGTVCTNLNADAVDGLHVTGSSIPGLRKITISTSDPSGGSDGDVWFKYIA